ncbi:MAG: KpsF/GutQ family sugar-phosphate isomerase [Candidatus Ratteibacteria bacterium]|jgi:arabinose-5-phosphate isomerase
MDILKRAREIFKVEISAIEATGLALDEKFKEAVEKIAACTGRVVITGMGKSGIIGRKIAATLSSTGTPSLFLHPAEAVHGDLGMINREDIVLAISNSGKTEEVLRILSAIKQIGAKLIVITGNQQSPMAAAAETVLRLKIENEADSFGLVPTSSTAALLVLGDALALSVLERKGFRKKDYAFFHPGGELGRRLQLKVDEVMRSGKEMPTVKRGTSLRQALEVISAGDLGMVVVVDQSGSLDGVLTDGDLRRFLLKNPSIENVRVDDLTTKNPKTMPAGSLTATAVSEMEKHEIMFLVVIDENRKPLGVIHLHGVLGGKNLYGKE